MCCGYNSLTDFPASTFEICPICYWESDDYQAKNPTNNGGANQVSLQYAQKNFQKFGASQKIFLQFVRAPHDYEIKNPDFIDYTNIFSVQNIICAHKKVKSWADFLKYIEEIKSLGVVRYEVFVYDWHADYYDENNNSAQTSANYSPKKISENVDIDSFKKELQSLQEGKTDDNKFITMCAKTGIAKWQMNLEKMVCSYFDTNSELIFEEKVWK